ncbi:MAG: hypothetical protein WBA12_15800 [Catalinimonas sp.]
MWNLPKAGIVWLCLLTGGVAAQDRPLRFSLNESGTHYVECAALLQVWGRYNQSNPGTTLSGEPLPYSIDAGIRRIRGVVKAQITDRTYAYVQFGQNNLTALASRQRGMFIHDALIEWALFEGQRGPTLFVGGGLGGWGGFGRLAAFSSWSNTTLDSPTFNLPTVNTVDQIMRRYEIYGRGHWRRFNYRAAVSDPFPIETAGSLFDPEIAPTARFAPRRGHKHYATYWTYALADRETSRSSYFAGTYLGKKRVFNLGAGVARQQDAVWWQGAKGDTVRDRLLTWAVDIFYDAPLDSARGTALTTYAGFYVYELGERYLRQVGVMNPAPERAAQVDGREDVLNGPGNAFPVIGTGRIWYGSLAWLAPRDLLGSHGVLQPYVDLTWAEYDALQDPMVAWNAGVNWLLRGHYMKFTLNYQHRPIYAADGTLQDHRGTVVAQTQIRL